MDTEPLYSLDQLHTTSGGNIAFVHKMIELFYVVVEPGLAMLNQGYEQQDYKIIFGQSHKIKSNIRHFQIESILDDIKYIEHHAKEATNMDEIGARLEKVNNVLERVFVELKKELPN
jgi:hypothetical protein